MSMDNSGERRSGQPALIPDVLSDGRFRGFANMAKDSQTVEAETGIMGYGWLGYIEFATKDGETFAIDIFQRTMPGMSFAQSCRHAPATRLSYTTKLGAMHEVALIPRNAMQELMNLNSRSATNATSDAEDRDQFQRRNSLPAVELEPGRGIVIGRDAAFKNEIGSDSILTSRQHCRVDVSSEGEVQVVGLSKNPTIVFYAAPEAPAGS